MAPPLPVSPKRTGHAFAGKQPVVGGASPVANACTGGPGASLRPQCSADKAAGGGPSFGTVAATVKPGPAQAPSLAATRPPQQRRNQSPPQPKEPTAVNSTALRELSLEYGTADLTAATNSWHNSLRLGSGCYGAVYRGTLRDGSDVAVKVIDLAALAGAGESPDAAGFIEEITMLSKFRHPNLVTLLGWGKQGVQRYLVYEFLAGGDVFRRLHRSRRPVGGVSFVWHERLSVCLDASAGLSHMHNAIPRAFHRDIKSANILLDRHGTAKMADFGLSCSSGASGAPHVDVRTSAGTPGYKCPIYERTRRFTEASEVYSFAMVMLEVLTGLDPSKTDPSAPGGISYPVAEQIAPSRSGALDRVVDRTDSVAAWPEALAVEFGTLALRGAHAVDEWHRPLFLELVRALRSLTERFPSTLGVLHAPSTPSATCPTPVHGAHHDDFCLRSPTKSPFRFPMQTPPNDDHTPKTPQQQSFRQQAPSLQQWEQLSPSRQPRAAATHYDDLDVQPDALFGLELLLSTGRDVVTVPRWKRCLPLEFSTCEEGSGALVAPVGRQHQPQFLAAWLPDPALRGRISRRAFKIVWCQEDGHSTARLVACGSGAVAVDGKVLKQGGSAVIHLGSEIVLHSEQWVLLRFRLVVGSDQEPGTPSPQKGRGSLLEELEEPAAAPQEERMAGLEATMAYDLAVAEADEEEEDEEEAAEEVPLEAWRLVCTYAEGMPQSKLEALPQELRGINLRASGPGGVALLGREHQHKHFEGWLPDSSVRLNVSRTHLQLSACGAGVTARNVGSNPMCVGREALVLGQAQVLDEGKVLRFTRFTGGNRVCFLMLELARNDDPSVLNNLGCGSPLRAQPTHHAGSVSVKAGSQPKPALQRSMSSHAALQVARRESSDAGIGGKTRTAGQSYSPKRLSAAAKRQVQEKERTDKQPLAARSTTTPSLAHAVAARQQLPLETTSAGSGSWPSQGASEEESSPEMLLEVHGQRVQDVPFDKRCIGPFSLTPGQPMACGRRHQPQLYGEVLREDGLPHDDLFCIAYEEGAFCVVALNPGGIWHSKDCHDPEHIEQDGLGMLEPGDRLAVPLEGGGELTWQLRRAADLAAFPQRTAGTSPRRGAGGKLEAPSATSWWASSPWTKDEVSSPEARANRKIRGA